MYRTCVVRPAELPDYDHPPLDEVGVGVQFAELPLFSDAHIGLYWQKVRSDFPKVESHPRLNAPVEDFTAPAKPVGGMPPGLMSVNMKQRTWLISEDDAELVQLQSNLFMFNWRRREADYPRFEHVMSRFSERYATFLRLLEVESLPAPRVEQIEVVYVNWITDLKLHEFLLPGSQGSIGGPESPGEYPEDQAWLARFTLRDESSVPKARLVVECQSAVRLDRDEWVQGGQLSLSYRAPVNGPVDLSVIEDIALQARRTIVTAFDRLTTVQAHDHWGRR